MLLTNATSRLTPSAHRTAVLARPTVNTVFLKGVMRALGGLAPTADPYAGSAEARRTRTETPRPRTRLWRRRLRDHRRGGGRRRRGVPRNPRTGDAARPVPHRPVARPRRVLARDVDDVLVAADEATSLPSSSRDSRSGNRAWSSRLNGRPPPACRTRARSLDRTTASRPVDAIVRSMTRAPRAGRGENTRSRSRRFIPESSRRLRQVSFDSPRRLGARSAFLTRPRATARASVRRRSAPWSRSCLPPALAPRRTPLLVPDARSSKIRETMVNGPVASTVHSARPACS